MKSVMKHQFSVVPKAEIPRSTFDRSFGHKTTFDAGYLIPFLADEALPGDTFSVSSTFFTRLATPVFPIMDNLFLDSQFFAIPVRLLWQNWEKFNGAQDNPGDSIDFTIPEMTSPAGGYLEGTLSDYLGIPTKVASLVHSSLWHRAYNLVYNTWYRDQNLQNSVVVDIDDGPDDPADYVLLQRGKRHDYFTSCLPWPQKGDSVSIPLGTSADVKGLAVTTGVAYTNAATGYLESGSASTPSGSDWSGALPNMIVKGDDPTDVPNIYADLSNATAATINQLRQSFQIQKLLERDARGGTRYVELLKSHFGVTSPDFRHQRPEFLGGGSTPISVTSVPQTSSTDATTPQGNLAAYGTGIAHNHGFTKSFTEHCIILGLVSVRADLSYQQGLPRMFSRSTRYDFYYPALSHIGEQAVLNKEIYADGSANDDLVFGYQERHAEYRYKNSMVSGLFRSNATASLDAWHLSQDFSSLPALNASFIVDAPPVDRVIATPAEPHMLFDSYTKMHCTRPMPIYGVPGLIDHF